MSKELKVAKVSNRGNKFGIVCGSSILMKFKTEDLAREGLEKHKEILEYWSESVSVAVDNSPKNFVYL